MMNETRKPIWDLKKQTDHLISARRLDLIIIDKKKNMLNCEFCCPADHRVKLKESEKKDKYLNIVRKLKKLWCIKVTVMPIVTDTLSTVTKGLIQELEDSEIRGRVETIQTTALLRSARIPRKVLET